MAPFCAYGRKKRWKCVFFFRLCLNSSVVITSFAFFSFPLHWGFWAHKRINRLAVFRLPPEMQVFYKPNIDYITENAVNPDKRRYSVVGEAERHFIDLDVYGDSALNLLPKHWYEAVRKVGEDSLRKHGIVPWHIQLASYQLIEAFKAKDAQRILRISADLGHYIADAHVPLHTTRNYNGQFSKQDGIHGFWESRLPELFAEEYDVWNGPAEYQENLADAIWNVVSESHACLDSVFLFEKELSKNFKPDKKYSYELRNNVLTRSYSHDFSEKYHQMLDRQVERRMRASIKMVGNIWYTCWVNAGQPDLSDLKNALESTEEVESRNWLKRLLPARPEPED